MNKKYARKNKSELLILRVTKDFKDKLQECAYALDKPMAEVARDAIALQTGYISTGKQVAN